MSDKAQRAGGSDEASKGIVPLPNRFTACISHHTISNSAEASSSQVRCPRYSPDAPPSCSDTRNSPVSSRPSRGTPSSSRTAYTASPSSCRSQPHPISVPATPTRSSRKGKGRAKDSDHNHQAIELQELQPDSRAIASAEWRPTPAQIPQLARPQAALLRDGPRVAIREYDVSELAPVLREGRCRRWFVERRSEKSCGVWVERWVESAVGRRQREGLMLWM